MKMKWLGIACGSCLLLTLILVSVASLTTTGKWLGLTAAILIGIGALLFGVFADPNQARYIHHHTSSKNERQNRERWGTLFLIMSTPFIVLSLILLAISQ
ncbi:hypothetical protein AZ66_16705 [Paenibacillus sp. E194]|uniref:DUF5316 family protein n=1 Tax=Paenibacillus sp. E194 TaxID=1458845 RepID=UPI0005CB270B|nr:DUF5316 family protein [Paenibacillus sp. E194]KJB86800.1 hypothetical protein AZ66_16705 [Paenibacillus sp. E194]